MPISDLPWAIGDLTSRAPHLQRLRRYYEGQHDQVIPDGRTLSRTMRDLLDRMRDNLCDDVVDEPVERLEVLAWRDTQADGEDTQGTAASDLWDQSRGPQWVREVFRSSFREGDGYAIVQRNARGQVRAYPQRADAMAVRYSADNPGEVEVAAKAWRKGRGWRINLYYAPQVDPNAPVQAPQGIRYGQPWVERYTSRGTSSDGTIPGARSFQPVTDADGQGAPVEALEGDRIPVFHYPADEWGRYGRSSLDDVTPLQDALNKSLCDLLVAGEFTALPQRWATGVQVEYDPVTGDEKPLFRTGAERMIRTGSKDAAFGEFAAGDMSQFLNVQTMLRMEIARKGKLPLYSVSLDASAAAPSGLSLLVAEGRQVKRVLAAQSDSGLVLREQMAYMLTLDGKPTTAADLEVTWRPPQTRDEQALAEVLAAKVALGLPERQALIEWGYDAAEVDQWLADAAAAREDAAARLADTMGGRISEVPVPMPLAAQGGMAVAPPQAPAGASAPPGG